MRAQPSPQRERLTYIIVAELSLIVTALLVFQDIPMVTFQAQTTVSSIIYAAICILGIIAGISPKSCSIGASSERRYGDDVAGHHPDCGHFQGHTVSLGGRVYCAGCSGLVLGAFVALLGLVSKWYPFDLSLGFWLGVLLVGFGLAQHLIDLGSAWVHLGLNILFVVGTWFMFQAIQLMNLSFLTSAYYLIVSIFWIFTRIRASQWTHVAVCDNCEVVCSNRF